MRTPTLDETVHLLMLLVAALAGALVCTYGRGAAPSLADVLPEASRPRAAADGRYAAYFVFQRPDCESHLRTLTLFRRSPVAKRVRVAALLLVGTRADLAAVRERYGARPYGAPLRLISPAEGRTLRTLGYARTPFLVVTGGPSDVALTALVPSTPEQFVALGRLLPTLPLTGATVREVP